MVRELLRELAARPDGAGRYILYAREQWREEDLDERFQWKLLQAPDPLWHLLCARAADRECDVFLSSNSYLAALLVRKPVVSIVHDLTTFESTMRPNLRSTLIERATLGMAVRRSAGLVTVSRATADALIARFPLASAKTTVAPLGVAPTLREPEEDERTQLPAPGFVLAVGTLEPRKNLPRLVAAYGSLEMSIQEGHPLVVVGALGWSTGETLTALESLGDRCIRLGYVSDGALAELYRRCAVFCYPSLGEGFGLPVLEAMAAGAPVVTANVSSLPEVGGDAVEYANPESVTSIADALRQVLTDAHRREELSAAAKRRAEEFSWDRFATILLRTLATAAPAPDQHGDTARRDARLTP